MIILVLALLFAILEWVAEVRSNQMGIFWTKPTMMILLITWVVVSGDPLSLPFGWFVIGLIFCLGGDIFLMLPAERFFLPGLISFLLGHIAYILGFGQVIPALESITSGVALAFMLFIISGLIYRKLAQGMQASGNRHMQIPVAIYALVISIML